jgi:hypothetical protein
MREIGFGAKAPRFTAAALTMRGGQVKPEVAGLPTRTFAIRDQAIPPDGGGGGGGGGAAPAFDLSVNFVPITYPAYEPARVATAPGAVELWRVINAGADSILELQVGRPGAARACGARLRSPRP